jgi:glycosidase
MVLRALAGTAVLLLLGCVQRAPPTKVLNRAAVAIAYVRDAEHGESVFDVPAGLEARVQEALEARNLEGRKIPFEKLQGAFASSRESSRRLAAALAASDAPIVLVVETKVVFYSQLSGRYRWMVYAKIAAATREHPGAPSAAEFDQPTFVEYDHEREPEVLGVAAPSLAERVGRVVDALLAPAHAPTGAADSVYFILVDRFANGDRGNDGEVDPRDPQAFHGGDLQGVVDHLDDLAALGVRTLWLTPVWKMRTEKFFGFGAFHGYWTVDPAAVEPRFGDEALLRRLSGELHRRGMRLVLDLVLNHVGPDAPLAKEKPAWFHHRGPVEHFDDPKEVQDHDVKGLPDLAQENPEVRRWLIETALGWIDRVHPDGFRLDAVKHVPLDFWRELSAAIHQKAPETWLLGEMLDGDPSVIEKVRREGGFDAMFDFPLHYAMVDVFCRGKAPSALGAAMFAEHGIADEALVTLLDNHDLPRIASACGGDLERVREALRFLLATRGIPSLQYGTEVPLAGEKEPENRGDMRFDRLALRDAVAGGLASRRAHPALARGATRILAAGPKLFACARLDAEEAVIVSVNRGEAAPLAVPPMLGSGRSVPPGVSIEIVPAPGRGAFAAIAADARRQWREGNRRRAVVIEARGAPEGVRVVGSGDLGGWRPERGLPTQDGVARAELPAGGAYEWKLVAGSAWEPGENRSLFVAEGEGPLRVVASWGVR